jgi:hypothetical protein
MAGGGMDSKYLKELQQVLEAEAALARSGVDLLADPEYRALRERFIDGDMPIEEFIGRVEGLAEIRPDEDEAGGAPEGDGPVGDEDLAEDDEDDLEDLRMLKDLSDQEGMDDGGTAGDDADR